jgi:phosphate-selective porin OprO and OprP
MRIKGSISLGCAVALIALSASAAPSSQATAAAASKATQTEIEILRRELDAQARKLRELEKQIAREEKAVQNPAQPASIGTVNANRWTIESADGQNLLRFGGLVQADGRYFADEQTAASANTLILRRVRPILEGTLDGIYDFRIMPDFAGGKAVVDDAYVAARFASYLAVTVGKFKVPVGLEQLQSPAEIRFIERGLPADLVPNRDLGVRVAGDVAAGRIGYALGYFDGVVDGTSSDNNPTPDVSSTGHGDAAARLFLRPFILDSGSVVQGLGFGIAGTYTSFIGSPTDPLLPSYKTVGQQTFFSYRSSTAATATTAAASNGTYAKGERLRWTPQLYYSARSVGFLAEYVHVSQDVARDIGPATRTAVLTNTGWQAQLSWFVTGENESYRGFTPRSTFALGKPGWGAFELVARYSELAVDRQAFLGGNNSFANPATSAREAQDAGIGVNWYLNQNVKWALDYDQTHFEGFDGSARPDEKALFMRVQLAF